MNKLLATIKLLRPVNLILSGTTVLIAAAIVDSLDHQSLLLRGVLVVISFTGAANALNDYLDLNVDLINRRKRPLPKGDLSTKSALVLSVILFGVGTVLSMTVSMLASLIAVGIAMPLIIAYNIRLKGTLLIGNATVSLILAMAFLFSGALFGAIDKMITPACLTFAFTLVREFIKDMADLEGDRQTGTITFPVKYGLESSAKVVIGMILVLAAVLVLPFAIGIYSSQYLITALFGIGIPLTYIIILLMRSPSTNNCQTSARVLKVCIFVGLLAVYLG